MSFGSSELIRKSKFSPYKAVETGGGMAAKEIGLKEGQDIQFPKPFRQDAQGPDEGPPPPADPVVDQAEPTPTFAPPNPSESAAMRRRKRLAALRMGIASTIKTSGTGADGNAALLAPTAAGGDSALKKALGA